MTLIFLGLACAAGCVTASPKATPAASAHPTPPAPAAPAPVPAANEADVEFMSGMIPHHAQAVIMAGWAPTHGARPDVAILCERIVVGQRDEIALMQHWLADRHEAVPSGDPSHVYMRGMSMMDPSMMMPGMLTDQQMAQLDAARGPSFDQLFLRFMIQHHEGAITMVNELFASQGGGEEDNVYRMAANVFADQTTEIDRMQKMLAALMFGANNPQ
jgi:uncharacterized protein (DUF305 family)